MLIKWGTLRLKGNITIVFIVQNWVRKNAKIKNVMLSANH